MKQTLALIIALVMALSLMACDKTPGDSSTEDGSNITTNNPIDNTNNSTGHVQDATQNTTDHVQDTTQGTTEPSATTVPVTTPPATQPPATQPPATQPPATQPPATQPPATQPPTTQPPATQPPATTHTHTWSDATCTAPKTCSVCNATEGNALGHTWSDATCTAPKTCSVCNATEGNALGHTWSDATCTAPKTCSVCNATEGNALGHTWSDATCTAPKTCSTCNATEGNVADHSLDADGLCKWCNQTVVVDPSNLNANIAYTYLGAQYSLPGLSDDCHVLTLVSFDNQDYSCQNAVYKESDSPVDGNGYTLPHHHNNKYYMNIAQASWFGGETTYKIEGSEIVAHFASEGEKTANTIHFVVLSDGTLKVSAVYGATLSDHAQIPVGAIFYPNSNPHPRENN